MGTISVSLPSDGQTADAADYNVPINTIVSEINGALDSDNIAAGGVVPNSLSSGTGTSWAWQSWTPTYTNITVGNGTVVAKFIQVGKTVIARWRLTCGSTTSISNDMMVSLPVTANSEYEQWDAVGTVSLVDASVPLVIGGLAQLDSTTLVRPLIYDYNGGTDGQMTGAFPITEAAGDKFGLLLIYQAA